MRIRTRYGACYEQTWNSKVAGKAFLAREFRRSIHPPHPLSDGAVVNHGLNSSYVFEND